MKNILALSAFCICMAAYSQTKSTETLTLEGAYQQKNILVKNAYGPGGVGYGVVGVKVNTQYTTDKINGDLFLIDLSKAKIKNGEHVKIEIIYQQGSVPVIINPGALSQPGKDNVFKLTGKFRWQNVFVYNPLVNGKHSVTALSINGKEYKPAVTGEITELDLIGMASPEATGKLKDGDDVSIEIKYAAGYDPIVINPEAVR